MSVATELDHTFTTTKPIDQSWAAITDLGRLVPCVQGGRVLEKIDASNVKAEIVVKMGAMAMEFTGTVQITEQNAGSHRAVMEVKAREKGGQGNANANVTFSLNSGGGSIHTRAQITGKAASMGEGAITGVLDALIKDFTGKLANM
jgi:carbon monoxide dehydrogenase subunit G